MNPETIEAKIQAQEIAVRYLRRAFDLPGTSFNECLQIIETCIYYSLPCVSEMLDDLECAFPSRVETIQKLRMN